MVMIRQHAALVHDALTAYQHYFQILRRRTLSALLECDLSLHQVQVIVFLANQDTASVSMVASQLGMGRPSASLLIDSLVQRGLVSRCDDPADRRRAVVRLTAEGVGYIDALFQGGQGDPRDVLVAMETTDLLALLRGLQALAALASGHDRDDAGSPILRQWKNPGRSARCA